MIKKDLLKCGICKKPYINTVDKTGKISKHIYKGNCKHIPKNMRINIGYEKKNEEKTNMDGDE